MRCVEVRRSLAVVADLGGVLLRYVDRRGSWVARENVRVVLGCPGGEVQRVVRDAYRRLVLKWIERSVGRIRVAPFAVSSGELCVSIAFGDWSRLPRGVMLLDGGAPPPRVASRLVLVVPDEAGGWGLWTSPLLPPEGVLPAALRILRASPGLYEWRRPLLLHRDEVRLRDGVRYGRWRGGSTRPRRPARPRRPPPAPP